MNPSQVLRAKKVNNIGELYLNAEIVDHSRKFTYRCLVVCIVVVVHM